MMKTMLVLLLVSAPLAAADDARVDAAIRRGADYLLGSDLASTKDYGIGAACLGGLALLEAGTPADNPTLVAIRQSVRVAAIREINTYQVSLAILYLDRLGHPADVACIQILGARLLGGQGLQGGWGYTTFDQLGPSDEARVAAAMNGAATKTKLNPEAGRIVAGVARGQRAAAAMGGDDNSNTQFGIVGLWVARRAGVPTDPAFRRIDSRFLRSQSPADGGWGYTLDASSPSMTCAGLIGLAAAKASGEGELVAEREDPDKPTDDPFLKPPAIGQKTDGDDNPEIPVAKPIDAGLSAARDKAIERALTSLGRLLSPTGHTIGSGGGTHGGLDDFYFFWSLERVGVAYGIDTIGGVDWYKWGCKPILDRQSDNGSWAGNYSTPIVSTAFAMLFLKKSNFTSDLSRKISGKVKDPGSGELRGGRGVAISPRGTAPRKADLPGAPGVNPVRKTTEADTLSESLVSASDREWPARLRLARDTQGPQFTAGLVKAIAVLEGKRLFQAREALAERLTRMTDETLARMLAERDAEVRRAACLAVAMKDARLSLPGVIDCLADPVESVGYAAKAALKAMSNEDHGPTNGATDEEKRKAADAWRLWYETDKRKSN